MGIISSILFSPIRFILTLLFITALSLFVLSWAFADFTEYISLKPIITNILLQQIEPQVDKNYINEIRESIIDHCQSNQEDLTKTIAGINYTIKCNEVNETTDILDYVAGRLFDSFYYKRYDCNFITCFRTMNLVDKIFLFISEKTHIFLKDSQIKLLIVTAILGTVLFILKSGSLSSKIRSFGILFILVGLPGLFIYNIIEPLKYQTIPKESIDLVSPLINEMLAIIGERLSLVAAVGIGLVIISFIVWFIEKRSKK